MVVKWYRFPILGVRLTSKVTLMIDVDVPVAVVSVSGAFDGVKQHPDLKIVDAVLKDAQSETDVTRTESAQYVAYVREKYFVETVDLVTCNKNVHDSKRKAVSTQ